MTHRKPNVIDREHIPVAMLLGAALGAGLGLYLAPSAMVVFSLLGGVAGGALVTWLMMNQPKRQVIAGRRVLDAAQPPATLPRRGSQNNSRVPLLPGQGGGSMPLHLGSVALGPQHETGHIFMVGRSGSGKSQGVFELLETLRQRSDFRVVVLDRGGELMQRLYRPNDLLFNPLDGRSVAWCHRAELRHLPALTLARAFLPVPEDHKENAIWYEQGQLLLATLWETCQSNEEVNHQLLGSHQQLQQWVQGSRAAQMFDDPRLAASVRFTLSPVTQCYDYLMDGGNPFSFFAYGQGQDPRWLYLPLIEEQTDLLKAPFSAAMDLIIRGVLSQEENAGLKTAIVIDELGALQKLPSLKRLLAEGRKKGGCAILGTQTEAQMNEVYGPDETRILLQNTRTKLILNCADPETANRMAETIGKCKVWQRGYNQPQQNLFEQGGTHWSPTDDHVVPPYELQMLPDCIGYLLRGDKSPVIKVQVPVCRLPRSTPRFVPRTQPIVQLEPDRPSLPLADPKRPQLEP